MKELNETTNDGSRDADSGRHHCLIIGREDWQETATEEEKQAARLYAAKSNRDLAANCFDPGFGFGDHVTEAEKLSYASNQLALAEKIEAGECDQNFCVWQEMHYFFTRECIPFLPQTKAT